MSYYERDIDRLRLQSRVSILRGWGRRIEDAVAAAISAYRGRKRRQQTLLHLSDLPDWQLDDVGLTRSEVEQALARNGIERDPVQLFERS